MSAVPPSTQSASTLPDAFADLDRFAEAWALGLEWDRSEKRATSSMADLNAYYAAVGPRMKDIAAHLDRFSMDSLPEPERRLLNLALMYMDVAIAVEFFRQPEVPSGYPRDRWVIESAQDPR